MAFTRFHDDPCRINKQLQESTGLGRYMLNVPGNGSKPMYMESDLFGLSRNANRDDIQSNDYRINAVKSQTQEYPSATPSTDQSRATHPAWEYRDLEQTKLSILPLNPQENICFTFQNNLSTRILEKDTFTAKAPRHLFDQ